MNVEIKKPSSTRYLALANDKGGVLKTTLAIHLARAYSLAGWSVLLADCDDNQSALKWAARAENFGFDYSFKVCGLMGLNRISAGADLIILDTAAQLSSEQKKQLEGNADLILIPTQPTADAIGPTLETAVAFSETPYRLCFTQVPTNSKDEKEFRDMLTGDGYLILDSSIRQAIGVPRASAAGKTVDAMANGYRLAWMDFVKVAKEVSEILESE